MKKVGKMILCCLFVSAVESHFIEYSNSSFSAINDLPISQNHTRKLLELCFSNRMNPVIITKDVVNIIHGMPDYKEENISVITIDANFTPRSYGYDLHLLVYPSYPTVILSGDSLKGECFNGFSIKCFSHGILHIRDHLIELNYWSSTTTFLVAGNQCGDAWEVLETLWYQEIYTSYFLCPNEFDNNTMIYTMNPFGDRAPKPWEKSETPDKPCDACTFYQMPFINEAKICSSVTFDKTEFLSGYKLSGTTIGYMSLRKTKIFFKNLWYAMNVTCMDYVTSTTRRHLQILTSDLTVLDRLKQDFANIIPYFAQGGYVIVTQKQSFVPTFDQVIDSYFTRERIIMSSIILIVIFLMMFLNNRYDFSATVLDLLAFLLDMGISTPILRLSMRITFMSATLFALIFNPVLQGQVISLLSRPGHRNVQSLRDLRDHNYHVYFRFIEIEDELRDSQLWDNDSSAKYWHSLFLTAGQDACLGEVRNNTSAACILDYTKIEHIDENLHYSTEFSIKYRAIQTSQHFPLNEKINKIALKLFETGHLSYAESRAFQKILLERKRKIERIKALMKYNQLDLEDFELLYISVTLASAWAIIIFGIEVLIKKISNFLDKRAKESEMRKLMIRETIASTVRRIAIITQQL